MPRCMMLLLIIASAAACSDAGPTALAPAGLVADDVEIMGAKTEATFGITVEADETACSEAGYRSYMCTVPGDNFVAVYLTVRVDPRVERGSLVFWVCRDRSGLLKDKAACLLGEGRWDRTGSFRVDEDGRVTINFLLANSVAVGWKWKYMAQGSGLANTEALPIDIIWVPED